MVEPKTNQKKRNVDWDEIMDCCSRLAHFILEGKYNSIYGIPKGGIIPAVIIARKLNLPLVESSEITTKTLLIDEINDSGTTLKDYNYGAKSDSATLFQRYSTTYKSTYYATLITNDDWLIMPWE